MFNRMRDMRGPRGVDKGASEPERGVSQRSRWTPSASTNTLAEWTLRREWMRGLGLVGIIILHLSGKGFIHTLLLFVISYSLLYI
jgi:hypothetical protein